MNAIGVKTKMDAPSPEAAQGVEDGFVASARRAGAIKAGLVKENGQWGEVIGEFVDPIKDALFPEKLTLDEHAKKTSESVKPEDQKVGRASKD
jgi:hypothetical protein